jgi:ribose transport system substrate-binding protein
MKVLQAFRYSQHRRKTAGMMGVGLLLAVGVSWSVSASHSAAATGLRPLHKIVYVNPLSAYPAFNTVNVCFKREASKFGYQASMVGTTGSAVDNQGTINLIDQAVADGADGLLVLPLEPSTFAPSLKAARAKGVYVVGLNGGAASDGQQTEVGTSDARLGAVAADGLGAKYPNAQVGTLSLSATTTAHAQIIAGFRKEAAKRFPHMKIVTNVYDNGDATKDVDLLSAMMTAHPTVNAILSVEGAGEPAAVTAVKQAGRAGKVHIITFDLTSAHIADVRSGSLFGVADQGWCAMGKDAVDEMRQLSRGKHVPALVDTGEKFFTKASLPKGLNGEPTS